MTDTNERLEELRAAIRAENISWGELHELQGLGEAGAIDPGDVELREWAGLPEVPAAVEVAMAEYPGRPLERCSCGRLKPKGEPCAYRAQP